VKRKIRRQLERGKQKIQERLEPFIGGTEPREEGEPEISGPRPTYEIADRTQAIPCGGLAAIHQLVCTVGLPQLIDERLGILKRARPYQDSDHVLNIAYNVLCGGQVLDDIEHRRNDAAFLDMMGARAIPDPTTAGDFCRRFDADGIWRLMGLINEARLGVWERSDHDLAGETARIDADGSIVPTTGESKQGMDMSFKGVWGYHPLLISLANTGEPLFIVNRSGNRPSHEGAPAALDQAIDLCRRADFKDILLRGDTDFSMTAHLDRWDEAGVRFVFGYDANESFVDRAENLHPGEYEELVRRANQQFAGKPRAKQPPVKQERSSRNAATSTSALLPRTPQLKNGVRALRAPLNTLEANWAYMMMASLAWTIKAWCALLLPVTPRWRERHEADQTRMLRMEFRTFLQSFVLIPAQVLFSGRRLIIRLLAWRPDSPTFFRLLDAL
jgi:hypothetical protein